MNWTLAPRRFAATISASRRPQPSPRGPRKFGGYSARHSRKVGYYDWASGDAGPNNGCHGTFNQLFPWGHRYFGFMDLVGRQNIRDLNLQASASRGKHNFLVWYHIFHLAQARDALYNASGTPTRISPTGTAGTDVGQELDLLWQIVFNPRLDVVFGYSHFFAGSFVKDTNPVNVSGNADFYYSQWSWRF